MLFTKWVGHAWDKISSMRELIVRSFQKCGLSVPIDGSGDNQININGIGDYEVGDADSDTSDSDVATDLEEDAQDPFANL